MITTIFNLAKLLFDMWIGHHKMPQFIISDKDTKFLMGFRDHLFRKVGMKLLFNITSHQQTNGQIERVNGVLNWYLRNYVNIDKKDWGEHLSMVEFCYNSTTHLVIKMCPFKLTLGKQNREANGLNHSQDHSKEIVEMVKGHEDKYVWAKKTFRTSLKSIW